MSLRFILGRSGSGKSETCLRELSTLQLTDLAPKLLLLVPEQYSLQAERDMARRAGGGFLSPWVLSFGRLAHRVFMECGAPRREPLSDANRAMILRRVLMEREGELEYYQRAVEKNGFLAQLGDSLTECARYGLDAARLEALAKQLPVESSLARKLRDLARIEAGYREYLRGEYLAAEERLDLLAQVMPESRLLRGAVVYLDGFHGFTPQEYRILEQLLAMAAQVTVTLTMAPSDFECADLPATAPFFEPWDTARRLKALARDTHTPCLPPVFLRENRRAGTPALTALERDFFTYRLKPQTSAGSVRVISAPDRYAECEAVAREINRLVREEGCRYRDLAVLTRDLPDYARILPGVLDRYQIPCFVDSRETLLGHPLIELVRSALLCAATGYAYEPLFRYAKTGLAGLDREACDRLENYVLAHGLDRYYFQKEFREPEQEALRQQLLGPLERAFPRKRLTVEDWAQRCYGLLRELETTKQLDRTDTRDRQSWQLLLDALDSLAGIMGDVSATAGEFGKLLDAGLGNGSLGLLPAGLDQVLVGDMERTRLPQCRAVFLTGVNEGVLPAVSVPTGLLAEAERERLTALGVELAPGGVRRALEENFLIYAAVTKPREWLYLTYPEGDPAGGTLRPSSLIHKIETLFPDCRETAPDPLEGVTSAAASFSELSRRLGAGEELSPVWRDALGYYMTAPDWQRPRELLLLGLDRNRREEPLPANRQTLYTSVSRLEKYVTCPYSYFLQYTLKARPRQEFQLQPPDLGTLFHNVLERVSRQTGSRWREMTQAELDKLTEQAVEELLPTLPVLSRTASGQYLAKRLSRIAKRAVWTLARQMKAGAFEPLGYEVGFGQEELLPPIDIQLPDGRQLRLSGRIDRVDVLEQEGKTYVKIMDYKTGNKSFRLQDVYYGLQLQLLLYLDAFLATGTALTGQKALYPGGAFYFHIDDPILTTNQEPSPGELETLREKALALSGLSQTEAAPFLGGDVASTDPETFAGLLELAAEKAARIGQEILDGAIPVSPLRTSDGVPCRYCPYHGVCGFDPAYPAQKPRKPKADQ